MKSRFSDVSPEVHRLATGVALTSSTILLALLRQVLVVRKPNVRTTAQVAMAVVIVLVGAMRNRHSEPSRMTLYERLGGVYAIATVVDDFINRIMDDPRLNANTKVDEAHHRVARAGFKYLVTEQVCAASGGPQHYTGRSMRDSHMHLEIAEREWQAFMDDLRQTLNKFQVPATEQTELVAIVQSTKSDIVSSRA